MKDEDMKSSAYRRVVGLKHPIALSCLCDHGVFPLDEHMPRSLFKKGRPGETLHVQFRFRRHVECDSEVECCDNHY